MKRDMDLIREILLDIESVPAESDWEPKDFGKSKCEVLNHLRLMSQAGLISGKIHIESESSFFIINMSITWNGYEFLDACRNSKVWAAVKKKAFDSGISLTFEGLLTALKAAAKLSVSAIGL